MHLNMEEEALLLPLTLEQNVSVLGREEGYTVKYDLSLRDFLRAQAVPYIPT